MLKLVPCLLTLPMLFMAAAQAADPHSPGTTGQPSCSCQATPSPPGNSASAPGSAFNGSGISGTKYAGTQPQNSNNPKSVAQYDVACFQQSQH
ncbi:MAG: adenylate cyclase [Alphaproteobacteria bacterium]|nr:adenylate cyclase [Alphaproteobacteria bacterium]